MILVFLLTLEKPNFQNRYIILFNSIFVEKEIGQPAHHQHFNTAYKMYKEKNFWAWNKII